MEELELAVGPLTFAARAEGPADGELVLLLHGFPQTSFAWRYQLAALGAAGYRAIAPDQRGYSRRARPDDVASYHQERLVEDVIGMADALGDDRFHVVGHDFGGPVAWHTGARHADRLATLTAVSTPHPRAMARSILEGGEQAEKSSYMLFFQSPEAEGFFLDNDAAGLRGLYDATGLAETDEYLRVLGERPAMTAALNWYRALDRDVIERMGAITTPTLYAWSTEDPALGREAADETAEHVDGPYRFEVLDGVGHFIPEEAPEVLNRLLLEHVGASVG
jgi:pimeloyl-ACP methyl ester carboxylesterase